MLEGATADSRAIVAAGNNADLYEAIFRAHHLRFKRYSYAFVGRERPPPFYSNLTVLRPNRREQVVKHLRMIARVHGGVTGFKDGFAEFDLAEFGFSVLFEANWLWSAPRREHLAEGWTRIDNASDLLRWEEAWKSGGSQTTTRMFPQSLLCASQIAFFAKRERGKMVGGCIANRSADCVGLSNIFGQGDLAKTLLGAKAAVATIAPNLPVTGYAAGTLLTAAMQAGFEPVGELRIHVADAARL